MYGETLDGRLQAVASLYLLHLGVGPKLTSTRSDRWPPNREHGADVVVTNPPFDMSDAPGPGRRTGSWPYGPPPRGNDNFAWVQYVLGALVLGGRAVVVMPVKAGNSVSIAEREIRRAPVRSGAVECVITLPSHLSSATPVPVSLWLLRREWMSHRAAATAAPSLSSAALGHLPVRFPPIGQQRGCVNLLGELGRRVDAYASYAAAPGRLRTELAEQMYGAGDENRTRVLSLESPPPARPTWGLTRPDAGGATRPRVHGAPLLTAVCRVEGHGCDGRRPHCRHTRWGRLTVPVPPTP
ncbi:N-6 DNA methylase [Streptomyces gelaticus]|uniref:N-6 DNA methylase n=1 Tax=Streptomyces gelaticus TaxID=285446 RepID=UPI0037A74504